MNATPASHYSQCLFLDRTINDYKSYLIDYPSENLVVTFDKHTATFTFVEFSPFHFVHFQWHNSLNFSSLCHTGCSEFGSAATVAGLSKSVLTLLFIYGIVFTFDFQVDLAGDLLLPAPSRCSLVTY